MSRKTSQLNGGRRRRRRMRPLLGVLALAALAGGVIAFTAGGSDSGPPSTPPQRTVATAAVHARPPLLKPLPHAYGRRLAPAGVRVSVPFKQYPRSGLLFDLDTGQVLWRHDPERRVRIASLNKMMTALLVDRHLRPSAHVPVTRAALAYKGSGFGILPRGKRIRAETMLYGLLLPSANDAAIALAQRISGTVPRFVRLMNARARRLGLTCTRYSSPDGFEDAGNYSCAPDLAVLAREILARPRLARIVGTRSAVLPFPIKGGKVWLYNNNGLLKLHYPGTTGVKTGYTDASGHCLVATARRGPVRLGIVLLHSPDPPTQAVALLNAGFRALRAPPPVAGASAGR